MDHIWNRYSAPRTIEKMKMLGAILELPAKQQCQSSPFTSKLGQTCQIGNAVKLVAPKQLPGFWFFSIVMGADYSFYVKFNATFALTFFEYIISVLACVISDQSFCGPFVHYLYNQFNILHKCKNHKTHSTNFSVNFTFYRRANCRELVYLRILLQGYCCK